MKRNYRFEDDNVLDTNNANIDVSFSSVQVGDVNADDGDYFTEYGSEYMMRQYKYKHVNNTDNIKFVWSGRSTEATNISPILIQIWNVNSTQWETLARETRIAADVDFTATVVQSTNVSNYYDVGNVVTFRSYQQVI